MPDPYESESQYQKRIQDAETRAEEKLRDAGSLGKFDETTYRLDGEIVRREPFDHPAFKALNESVDEARDRRKAQAEIPSWKKALNEPVKGKDMADEDYSVMTEPHDCLSGVYPPTLGNERYHCVSCPHVYRAQQKVETGELVWMRDEAEEAKVAAKSLKEDEFVRNPAPFFGGPDPAKAVNESLDFEAHTKPESMKSGINPFMDFSNSIPLGPPTYPAYRHFSPLPASGANSKPVEAPLVPRLRVLQIGEDTVLVFDRAGDLGVDELANLADTLNDKPWQTLIFDGEVEIG